MTFIPSKLCVVCFADATDGSLDRCQACYRQFKRVGADLDRRAERKALIVTAAYACGELSEGQAARLLGIDRVTLRERLLACVDTSRAAWQHLRTNEAALSPSLSPKDAA